MQVAYSAWEIEVLEACRRVMEHGNAEFRFKVQHGRWQISEVEKRKNGDVEKK